MSVLEWVRFLVGGGLLLCGLGTFIIEIIGVFRFRYVLNRMHAAALGDTLGLFLVVLGLLILGKDMFHMLKYALIVIFFWVSSPIATHMIAKVELLTDKDYEERMRGK